MKKVFLLLSGIALLFAGGCKYDDDAVWEELQKQAARIAALEKWQETVNGNITTLQGLVSALQNNDYVTSVVAFTTPAPGGYRITFSKSGEAVIWNGSKGDPGEDGENGIAPVIGVAEYPAASGVYYWTLDGKFIEAGGEKLPALGAGAGEGNTPKLQINTTTNFWEVSYDDGKTWESLGVKATGPAGPAGPKGDAIFSGAPVDREDYWEFTLVGGGKIELPKYKDIGITFGQPPAFAPDESKGINFTITGNPTDIRIVGMPPGWTYFVNIGVADGVINITAPSTLTDENAGAEATVLVADGNRVAAMYGLTVGMTGMVGNTVGSRYYENGKAVGVVYREASMGLGSGLILHKDFYIKVPVSAPGTGLSDTPIPVGIGGGAALFAAIQAQFPSTGPSDGWRKLGPWDYCDQLGAGWFVAAGNEPFVDKTNLEKIDATLAAIGANSRYNSANIPKEIGRINNLSPSNFLVNPVNSVTVSVDKFGPTGVYKENNTGVYQTPMNPWDWTTLEGMENTNGELELYCLIMRSF